MNGSKSLGLVRSSDFFVKNSNSALFSAAVTKLDLLSVKYARRKENYGFAEASLVKLLKHKSGFVTNEPLHRIVLDFSAESEFTILTSKLHREAAKLLAW